MKKILLFLMFAAGMMTSVSAATLSFQYQGETVPQNGSVVFEGYERYPYSSTKEELFMEPKIYIVSDVADKVNIKVEANSTVQLCIGGQCEAGTELLKQGISLGANTPEDLLLDGSIVVDKGAEADLPVIEVSIQAWYTNDPDNVVSMTLKMGGVNAGVESLAADQNYITLKEGSIVYDLNAAAQLGVYSLSGKSVVNQTVSGAGSISLQGLSRGVYVYRLAGKNGKTIKADKFVIR